MIFVVILAYNEEAGIEKCLGDLDRTLRRQNDPYRFVVVNDGSTDETARILERLSPNFPISVVRHPNNLGVGRAFDSGLRRAAEEAKPDDVIITIEGDRTNDPSYFLDMLRKIAEGADVVCASRYRPGGRYVGFPWGRRVFSFGANWCMRLLFPVRGVRDFTIFYRAYRAEVIQAAVDRFGSTFIERSGFTSNAEILYKVAQARAVRCDEVPLVYRYDQKKGRSKMRVLRNLAEYSRLFLTLSCSSAGVGFRQSAALAALALALGCYGSRWGLPSEERSGMVLPPGLEHDGAFKDSLATSYSELYRKLEENRRLPIDEIHERIDIAPAHGQPSPLLLNSYRSFLLRSENPDEQKSLSQLARMRPSQWRFEPLWVDYGGAYLYPLGAWYAALSAVRLIRLSSDIRLYVDEPARIAAIFWTGRLWSALSIAVCAALVAALARDLGGAAAGWFAGLLFLALPETQMTAHTLKPYGWATLWALIGLRLLFEYLDEEDSRAALAAGVAFGLCVGSTIAYWFVGAALWLAFALKNDRRWRDPVIASLLAAAAAVMTNPYLVWHPRAYAAEFQYLNGAFPVELSVRRVVDFCWGFLPAGMGLVAAWSTLATALYAGLRRGTDAKVRLIAWMFLAGCVQLALRVADPGFLRQFFPFFAIGAVALAAAIPERGKAKLAVAALLVVALLDAGTRAGAELWSMHVESAGRSTRLEAGRWVAEHLASGTEIGLVAPPQPSDTPPFRLDQYKLVLFSSPDQLKDGRIPEFVIYCEIRDSAEMRRFLERNYRVEKLFALKMPLPWLDRYSRWTLVNPRIEIFKKNG